MARNSHREGFFLTCRTVVRAVDRRALAVFLLALGLLALLPSGASADPAARLPSVDLPGDLQRVLTDYETGWAAGDEDALAALFVADGFVSGPADWLRGHDAIREKYADMQGDLRLRAVDFGVDGDVAFIVGAYGYGEEAASVDRGKFVLALERADGTSPWKIVVDLDRSNRRLAAPAPAPAEDAISRDIDETVWNVVSSTVAANDLDGMAATYHPDAVLVTGKGTLPIAEQLDTWGAGMERLRSEGRRASVAFRFASRQHDATTAFERGLFRYAEPDAEGVEQPSFVPFEALLVKHDGRWLMVMERQFEPVGETAWNALAR